jgi:hypothetical protein
MWLILVGGIRFVFAFLVTAFGKISQLDLGCCKCMYYFTGFDIDLLERCQIGFAGKSGGDSGCNFICNRQRDKSYFQRLNLFCIKKKNVNSGNSMKKQIKRYLKTILLACLYLINFVAPAQDLTRWKELVFSSGVDTAGLDPDAATIKRIASMAAYGSTPFHVGHWQIPQQVDSARLGIVANSVLKQSEGWADQWTSLEPNFIPYKYLRSYLDSLPTAETDTDDKFTILCSALNQYRWLNRIPSDTLIVINIPSATLRVITKSGEELLYSPVILGQPKTPTPLFGAYLTRIITFPYWNVPRSIATREILPKIKRDPAATLDNLKMQVLDSKGKVLNPDAIDWKSLSVKNFPYRLRQSTGCDNALGVIKFDLNSPYDVYLHDTNHRELFAEKNHFLSHGCIRLAKPVELANLVLQQDFFKHSFLETQKTNVPSKTIALPVILPVIITYELVDLDSNNLIRFYPDVYGWKKVKM